MQLKRKWKFAVDRGGTFTDVAGIDPEGRFHTLKLLSNSPEYTDASIEGIKRILGLAPGQPLPSDSVEIIRFGTTVATNALLERKGGRVALFITKGFKDLLEIGYQDRPSIFSLCIRKQPPLYKVAVEVDERINPDGTIERGIDVEGLRNSVRNMLDQYSIDSVAVVLMHSWINPAHEIVCGEVLDEAEISSIYLSHKSVNLIKIVSRGQSTLVDAYLGIVLSAYLDGIKKETGDIRTQFMQSSGLLCPPDEFSGKNALLSGPAGGVVAVARLAGENGLAGAVGFDMGGTSTDVSRFDGSFLKRTENEIAGIPLHVEMMDIVTVAAGGGSILGFDGRKMHVGPESAGAMPGPACYGFGGPLTVTDANLITGRMVPERFPKTFGKDRNAMPDSEVVYEKFSRLADTINREMGMNMSPQDVATGYLRIANEKMAMAIREISVSRGVDIRNYALICFGGAGPQHACPIAELLDIKTIIVHPLSGVMSAYGMALSVAAKKGLRTILMPFDHHGHEQMTDLFRDLEKEMTTDTALALTDTRFRREVDLRPAGTESFITVEFGEFDEMISSFLDRYEKIFGFKPDVSSIEAVNIKTEIPFDEMNIPEFRETDADGGSSDEGVISTELYYPGGNTEAVVYSRLGMPTGEKIKGPAIITDPNFTVVVDQGFSAQKNEFGIITMEKESDVSFMMDSHSGEEADPVLLEVFGNTFMGIASEMGHILRNTAHSVNMKERLDFSCALFDSEGSLVANAPHIPVHLGAMADAVRALIEQRGNRIGRGQAFITNNPYRGGTHLPDVTVICPVFSEDNRIIFFTASRGHHADIGGTAPGSMPARSSHIEEEGVVIDNFLYLEDGRLREDELRSILVNASYPARNIEERLADCRAQLAACRKGISEIQRLIRRYGIETVSQYMKHIQNHAEYTVRNVLMQFIDEDGGFEGKFEDSLDDGTIIKAAVKISRGNNPPDTVEATIDFSGSGLCHGDDNLNAPYAVTRSAVLYVLRSLVNQDLPLNSGCLKPVKIIIPGGTILNPVYPAPVASGNVETSQRVVDVLLGAFGVAAASQGTMNNLLFEIKGETPYYETVAGGAGAMLGCHGASAVQVHMTNTRITDPEILEHRHPGLRLERFMIRRGSGGNGMYRGGSGVIREIRFLQPAVLSIISERRISQPYGINGGGPGKRGKNIRKMADGRLENLSHREVLRIEKGESIIVKTPGGGGYGVP